MKLSDLELNFKWDGNKVYIGTSVCIALIVFNHFVCHVPGFSPAPYDGDWLFHSLLIAVVGYGGRSALKKLEAK